MGQTAPRVFTEQELKKYDGSRKMPVYIAYNGLVYDVTASPHWRGGEHRNLHYAGQDLTSELPDAPHSDLVFRKFPVVGILKTEDGGRRADDSVFGRLSEV